MLKLIISKIKNFNKYKSIADKYFLVGFFIILCLVVIFAAISIYQVKHKYKIDTEKISRYYIDAQKQIAKSKVEAALDIIQYKKVQTENKAKDEIKRRAYNAYNIALNIYKKNINNKSKQEIKELIKQALRPIRYENGENYIFIIDLKGTEILYPIEPQLENVNSLNLQDAKGNYVIREELRIVKKYKEGYVKNYWRKFGSSSELIYPGVSFVKLFKPLNWCIGTGVYLDDVEKKIKNDVIREIASIRFGKEGYVFINKYNGDALITNGKVVTDNRNLWELSDPNGVKVIQEERKAVENPDGGYIYYVWNKLSEPIPTKKVSFIKGFPDWQWMIGAGVYLDEIDNIVEKQKAELKYNLYFQTLLILIILIFFSFIVFFITRILAKSISSSINSLINFFKKASTEFVEIDVDKLKFPEFKLLAVAANKMIYERNKAYNDLSIEKAYFEELFESSPEAIVITDNNSKLLRMNKEFVDMFGYTHQEVLKTKVDELIIPSHLKEESLDLTRKVARGKIVFKESIRKRKDGKLIYVSILGTPIVIGGGQVAVYGIYRDISEQKEYEKSLKEAKEKAEKAVKFQSAFLDNLSHEIRTPMNAIVGFSNMLNKQLDDKTRAKYINIINESCMSLLTIIEDILDISKIESGQLKLSYSEVNINDVFVELYTFFQEKLNEQNKVVKLFFKNYSETESFSISTDVIRFRQILNKLIVNAIKFTEKGFVEFGCEKQKNNLVFYVKDTGIGIAEDQFEHIFDRFRKIETDNSVLYGGTGLGLSISKKLVEMLHGRIWLESELGKGSTFYFTVPSVSKV
ncbi:MAG: cache domain-containing protein [Bacteroidales bacterium]|nr:cache domain-containing protein [Bacteroidales bacterium]